MAQRDIFIKTIISELKKGNDNLVFLSADFGAPALDELRTDHPKNFFHCGISEQAMVDMAVGLALAGKTVFCYAMAPFLSLRAIEQVKTGPAINNLPVILISVGYGLGYADAGPTHYCTEDLACLCSIPKMSVYSPSDGQSTKVLAYNLIKSPSPTYVRLDRQKSDTENQCSVDDIKKGYRVFLGIGENKKAIVCCGSTVGLAHKFRKEIDSNVAVIELLRQKPFPTEIIDTVKLFEKILIIDEHVFYGGLFSIVSSHLSLVTHSLGLFSIHLPDQFIFENGGRNYLLEKNGFNLDNIKEKLK